MTPEQKLMWDILKGNIETVTIEGGKKLKKMRGSKSGTKPFQKKADELLGLILDLGSSDEELIRAVKTLLMGFNLPLEPNLLDNFKRFNDRVGHRISTIGKDIQPYDIS